MAAGLAGARRLEAHLAGCDGLPPGARRAAARARARRRGPRALLATEPAPDSRRPHPSGGDRGGRLHASSPGSGLRRRWRRPCWWRSLVVRGAGRRHAASHCRGGCGVARSRPAAPEAAASVRARGRDPRSTLPLRAPRVPAVTRLRAPRLAGAGAIPAEPEVLVPARRDRGADSPRGARAPRPDPSRRSLASVGQPSPTSRSSAPIDIKPLEIVPLDPAETSRDVGEGERHDTSHALDRRRGRAARPAGERPGAGEAEAQKTRSRRPRRRRPPRKGRPSAAARRASRCASSS